VGVMIIKDPEVAKLFADDTRRRILHLLRHNEMSTTDLVKVLQKPHSSVQHHLALLMDAELVELAREKKVRNMVQPYYRTTAHRFLVSYSLSETLTQDEEYSTWHIDTLNKMFSALGTFSIKVPEELRGRVIELLRTCYDKEQRALEEVLEQQSDPVALDKSVQRPLLRLMTNIKLAADQEYATAIEELSKLIGP
jgi:DNA-binding transcriptional ArsR family regulator